eukprot:c24114_g1_i1 orf=437-3007(-)
MPRNQASLGLGQGEIGVELSDYQRLAGGDDNLSPEDLLQGESSKSEVIADLDHFFERLYTYHCEKGLWCIVTQWIVELLSLGFIICFSGFFLLFVDWHGLQSAKCGIDALEEGTKPCDLVKEALNRQPLKPFTFFKAIVVTYLAIFSLYWIFCFLRFFTQLKETLEIRKFYRTSLGVTDRELQTTSWSILLDKIVQLQGCQRLCIVRDLSAHDVVMRIMRKENYFIGMLNKGVLALPIPSWVPGAGPVVCRDSDGVKKRLLLTKTLEWSLNWCILQNMFDRNFLIRREFTSNPARLRKRLMAVGFGMLLLSPFLIIFMFVYFFLRHAEEFYHQPSTATSRRWSNLAKWIFREFNELDHMFKQRLNNSYRHALEYVKQFPSVILSLVAKFVAFVAGGFAAVLIIIAFLDESLLEAHLFGRNLFWFAAVFGTVTAISRSAIMEEFQICEPEKVLQMIACYTHYMPKHWRGAENKDSVRAEFEALFQYTGLILLEELVSIFVTPYALIFLLPKQVDAVLQFILDFTVSIEGVGDVCSLSVFDFEHHGNSKYGSPFQTSKDRRSCQGKMEKSFLSFKSSYPNWEPHASGKQFLSILAEFELQRNDPEIFPSSPLSPWQSKYVERVHHPFIGPPSGNQWQVSPSCGIEESFIPGRFRDYPAGQGSKNQLYWLVDRFYASKTSLKNKESQPVGVGRALLANQNSHCRSAQDIGPNLQHSGISGQFKPIEGLSSRLKVSTHRQMDQKAVDEEETSRLVPSRKAEGSHWWARVAPQSSAAHGSFLEPPIFSGRHFTESNFDSSPESEDDDDHAWNTRQFQGAYSSSVLEDKSLGFDLPFGDVYAQSRDFSVENNRPLGREESQS